LATVRILEDLRILAYACEHSGYLAYREILSSGQEWPSAIEVMSIPCGGRIGLRELLETLERGYHGVLVLACPQDACRHLTGSRRVGAEVARARRWLEQLGLEPGCVGVLQASALDAARLRREVASFHRELAEAVSGRPAGDEVVEGEKEVDTSGR